MPSLTRKEFLRLAAIGLGALAGGRFLAACGSLPPAPAATQSATIVSGNIPEPGVAPTTTPTTAPESSPTSAITSTASPVQRSDIIQYYPSVPSRVVHTHHQGVWDGDTLLPEALKQMLDSSITRLTGLSDTLTAWQALFSPTDRVAIKVNSLPYGKYWTHVPLVLAVVDRLQAAGVPAELAASPPARSRA